jgi:hypothetical protein
MMPGDPGYSEGKAIFKKYVVESNSKRHEMDYRLSKATQQMVAYRIKSETGETVYTSEVDRDVL